MSIDTAKYTAEYATDCGSIDATDGATIIKADVSTIIESVEPTIGSTIGTADCWAN